MSSVELLHVDKSYEGDAKVVDDFNLSIADHEFIVLVGPSGCGKSTTLRMIAGLERVTRGTISIGGRVVNDVPPKDRDIAMVFQSYALYPHMTVYENMSFGLVMRKMPKKAIEARVGKAASMLGIVTLLDRKPKQLSGGQRQRVALGRAIVRDPQCFLFDEPLSNLDAKLRVEMRIEIKRIHSELGSTTVYVTHDQEEAITLGDRLVVMRDGVIQQCAAALEIYRRPTNRFVASFLGSPPMNFFDGTLVERDGALFFDEGSGLLPVPPSTEGALRSRVGQPLTLGGRPDALSDQVHARFATGSSSLPMKVWLVQPLGATMHVHLATARHSNVVAHVEAFSGLSIGDVLPIHFDPKGFHFFEEGELGYAVAHSAD
jgi:multiple sugar transport system ATP-binding protein